MEVWSQLIDSFPNELKHLRKGMIGIKLENPNGPDSTFARMIFDVAEISDNILKC